jgi:hypothetical protein
MERTQGSAADIPTRLTTSASAPQGLRISELRTSDRGLTATVSVGWRGQQKRVTVDGSDSGAVTSHTFDRIFSELGMACPLRLLDMTLTESKMPGGRSRWVCRGRIQCTTDAYLFYKSGSDVDQNTALLKMICRAINTWARGVKQSGRHPCTMEATLIHPT